MESIHRNQLDEMIKGFFRGKLLCATVRLGLADVLGDAEKSVTELAALVSANPDSLYRSC